MLTQRKDVLKSLSINELLFLPSFFKYYAKCHIKTNKLICTGFYLKCHRILGSIEMKRNYTSAEAATVGVR